MKDTEFEIYHGDTLTNDWDMLLEPNPAKMRKFDAVVANPPFSYRWEAVDLDATHGELVRIEKKIQAARDRHNKYLKELGLPPLP